MVLKIQAGQVTKMLYSVIQSYRTPTVRIVSWSHMAEVKRSTMIDSWNCYQMIYRLNYMETGNNL